MTQKEKVASDCFDCFTEFKDRGDRALLEFEITQKKVLQNVFDQTEKWARQTAVINDAQTAHISSIDEGFDILKKDLTKYVLYLFGFIAFIVSLCAVIVGYTALTVQENAKQVIENNHALENKVDKNQILLINESKRLNAINLEYFNKKFTKTSLPPYEDLNYEIRINSIFNINRE